MKKSSMFYYLFLLIININIVSVIAGSSDVSIKSKVEDKKIILYATDNVHSIPDDIDSAASLLSPEKDSLQSALPFSRLYNLTFGAFFVKLIIKSNDQLDCGCLTVERSAKDLSKIHYIYTPNHNGVSLSCKSSELLLTIEDEDTKRLFVSKEISLDRKKTKNRVIKAHSTSNLSFNIVLQNWFNP